MHRFWILLLLGSINFALLLPLIRSQNSAQPNFETISGLQYTLDFQGFNKNGPVNIRITETYTGGLDANNRNLKITGTLKSNTSMIDTSVVFVVEANGRQITFSQDETVIPLHKTELFLRDALTELKVNITCHELAIMKEAREFEFTSAGDDSFTFQGQVTPVKVFRAAGEFICYS